MAEKRKDSKGRVLRDGENQMPDGRYRYRYTDAAGKRQAVYSWKLAPTDRIPEGKRDCISIREIEKQIQCDLNDGIRTADSNKITLNDMYYEYMQGKRELKDSTRVLYNNLFQAYIQDNIGMKRLSAIKFSDIKQFYNQLIDRGLKISTVDLVNTILHPVLNLAVRDNIIRKNPTVGVIGEVKKSHNYQKTKRHSLSIEEQQAFIKFISKSAGYRHWLPLFTVLLGTGGRVGEITGLRWQDCDFKGNTISINHTLVYKNFDGDGYSFRITTPKTTNGCRTVPMLPDVKSALLQERKKQMAKGLFDIGIDGYRGFIFLTGKGNLRTPGSVDEAIKRICKAYNEEEESRAQKEHREPLVIRPFSAHNLRHTFCTRFCENETNIKLIQSIMGHASIGTTMDIYAEATEAKKQEAFENLAEKMKII